MIVFTPNTVIKSTEVNANFNEITATYTYKHQLLIKGDNTGGAVDSAQIGSPEVAFTGTPTNYGRASGIIPVNYAGGTIAIKVYLFSANANNQSLNYYVGSHTNGGSVSTSWNIQSNQTSATSINLSANTMKEFTVYTIPAGTVTAGNYFALAIRPNAAITGTIWYSACFLEYSANYK